MVWNNKGKGRSNSTMFRLTGLFKASKPGMYVGSMRATDLGGLVEKVKSAKAKERGLTFFIFRNDPDRKGPALSLLVDVERDRDEARPRRKPIQEDPFEDEQEEIEDEETEDEQKDPFGLDD